MQVDEPEPEPEPEPELIAEESFFVEQPRFARRAAQPIDGMSLLGHYQRLARRNAELAESAALLEYILAQ